MDESIRELLDPDILTEAYVQRADDAPTPLTDAFFVNPEALEDESFRMFYDPADTTPAPMNISGAEAHAITVGSAVERLGTLFTIFNKTPFRGSVLTALREPDSRTLQNLGRSEVNRVYGKFVGRHRTAKELVISKILTAGVVYLNARGEVLESSSGAVQTCDFGVAATHKTNLNGLISALWSTATTDIQTQLENIVDAARQAQVPVPTDIWLHRLSLASLRNNDYFADWATMNKDYSDKILRGEVITDLFGFNWHFIDTYYTAQDGSLKPFIPTTKAILTPPPGDPWIRAATGPTVLPKMVGKVDSLDQALSNLTVVQGPFAYAKLLDDPVQVMAYAGDKYGLNFAEPNAIWQATAFA